MISPTSSSAWQNRLSLLSQYLQPRPPANVRWGSFLISFTAALPDTLTYEEYRLVYSGPSGWAKFCILSPFHCINTVLLGSIIGNVNVDNWVVPNFFTLWILFPNVMNNYLISGEKVWEYRNSQIFHLLKTFPWMNVYYDGLKLGFLRKHCPFYYMETCFLSSILFL